MTEEPLQIGDRVQLRNSMDAVYPRAFAGSEGWVRDTKTDDDGFDLIYVVWDKNHWRYAGERDIWTFPSHFVRIDQPYIDPDVVGLEESDTEPEALSDLEAAEEDEDEEFPICPGCGERHPVPTEEDLQWNDYFETLHEAWQKAATADNFILITVAPKDDTGVLATHSYMKSFTPAHSHWMLSHMASMVAGAYQSVARRYQEEENGRQAPDVHPDDQEQPPQPE